MPLYERFVKISPVDSTINVIVPTSTGIIALSPQASDTTTNVLEIKDSSAVSQSTFNAKGYLGIKITAPTARIHTKQSAAGSVGESPIKIDSGVLLVTPEAGAIEYDGSNIYFTDNDSERSQIAEYGLLYIKKTLTESITIPTDYCLVVRNVISAGFNITANGTGELRGI